MPHATNSVLTYYGSEICAWCHATGVASAETCPVCGGKGSVLTLQPGVKCTRCKGTGRSDDLPRSPLVCRCVVCQGAGWLTRTGA